MAFDLSRFANAQRDTYAEALAELKAGRKRGHWMWFVFPQLRGLGHSETSRVYGIASIDEARAYLQDPMLGRRLVESTNAVLQAGDTSLPDIFGYPDDLKFISSMTLFSMVTEAPDVFNRALARFNDGKADLATVRLLSKLEDSRDPL